MINLEGITKEFPLGTSKIQVLKGISIFIQKGEFVSIMGPSGSGKSTLSSILGCLAVPTEGSYHLLGEDVAKLSPDKLASIRNEKIGFIFQDFNLLEGLSACENVMLPLSYRGVKRSAAKKRALEKLEQVSLAKWVNHRPNMLSGGQKQRVAIARALVGEPQFLFADEPTGALDQRTGSEIMGLLQKLNSDGHTVVQVTHSLSHCNYGKRILYLVDGFIVRDQAVQKPIFAFVSNAETSNVIQNVWQLAIDVKDDKLETFECLKKIYNLNKNVPSNIIKAAEVISQWKNEDSQKIIKEFFENKDWSLRAEAIKHCEKLGFDFANDLLNKGLSDDNDWVRFLSLSAYRDKDFNVIDEATKKLIQEKISDKDERIRATAISIFDLWKDESVLEKIKACVEDKDPRVRANSIEYLEKYLENDKSIVYLIKPLLNDSHNRVRANVVKALINIEKEDCLKTLKEMIASGDNLMRSSGAWSLRYLKDKKDYLNLLVKLFMHEEEETVLVHVFESIKILSKADISLNEVLKSIDLQASTSK